MAIDDETSGFLIQFFPLADGLENLDVQKIYFAVSEVSLLVRHIYLVVQSIISEQCVHRVFYVSAKIVQLQRITLCLFFQISQRLGSIVAGVQPLDEVFGFAVKIITRSAMRRTFKLCFLDNVAVSSCKCVVFVKPNK